VALVIIASHMAIPHKEYRFVFPVFACLALVLAVLPQGLERGILTFNIGCLQRPAGQAIPHVQKGLAKTRRKST
jgi:hypothetical protein